MLTVLTKMLLSYNESDSLYQKNTSTAVKIS